MGALTASLNRALGKADGWLSGQTRKDKRRFILEALIYLKKSKKNHLSSSSDGEDCMKVRTNMFEKARSSIIFPLLSWEECGGNNQSFQVEIHIIIADWINFRSLPKRSRLSVWTTTAATDPWYKFRRFVEAFNENRRRTVITSKSIVIDESMSAFRPRTTARGGMPNISYVKRKPKPMGSALQMGAMAWCCSSEFKRGKMPCAGRHFATRWGRVRLVLCGLVWALSVRSSRGGGV